MRYLFLLCSLLLTLQGHTFSLKSNAPSRYIVEPGDTLWSIANQYLEHPWEWKSLWNANPKIKNPNRLYPGAVIELRYVNQHPYLRVLSNGTVKLSPYSREEPLEEPIPPIPLTDILPFLDGSLVLDRDTLTDAPYILAFTTEHLLGGQGDEVYVQNLCSNLVLPPGVTMSYAIYRPCGTYQDPMNGNFLGYKATLVGYAELVRGGNPATVVLTDIKQGVRLEDKVMPNNHPGYDLSFEPRTPAVPIQGEILDLPGDFSIGALGLVVVIDRGKDAGLQPGDVLGVYTRSKRAKNNYYRYSKNAPCQFPCIKLPQERIGEVMVFRTFSHTSFGLVVRATRAIAKLDMVTNP